MEDLNTVRVDLTSRDGREVVENLIRGAGAPGALIGRARNGSAALKFRSARPHDTVPHIQGAETYQRVFELATRDGATRVRISTDSEAPLDGYKWDRETPHHELPVAAYTASDVGARIISAAFGLGLTHAAIVDRELADEEKLAAFKVDLAAGRIRIKTQEEFDAERDSRLVEGYEGKEVQRTDGPIAGVILEARARLAAWQRKQAAKTSA